MKQFFVSVFVFSILVVPGLTVSANDIQQWQVGETVTTVFNDAGQYEETMYTITLTEDQLVTFTINDTFYNVFVALKTAEGEPITVLRGHSLSDTPNETTMRVQLRKGTYYATLSGRDTKQAAASYTIAPLVSPYNIKPNDSEERANHIPTNTTIDVVQTTGDRYEESYFSFTLSQLSAVTLQGALQGHNMPDAAFDLSLVAAPRFVVTEHIGPDTKLSDMPEAGYYVLPAGQYTVKLQLGAVMFEPNMQFHVNAVPIQPNKHVKITTERTAVDIGTVYGGIFNTFTHDEYVVAAQAQQQVAIILDATMTNDTAVAFGVRATDDTVFLKPMATSTEPTRTVHVYKDIPSTSIIQLSTYGNINQARHDYALRVYNVLYRDVLGTHRYFPEIMQLQHAGLVHGYPDGTFQPNVSITRKQVLLMLSRDTNVTLRKVRDMIAFKDLVGNPTLEGIAKPFYEAGIIDGSDGTIRLNNTLTRAQLAKILVNTYGLTMQGEVIPFSDVSTQHGSYHDIQILASNGITTGDNGEFMPNVPVSRQHFAVFLSRIVNK
ncbi:S-layer homology domain-containing protein [Caryophanon tenue]|uniref:SLH domain-containing protein n=1 Tax=Caryophanon tenue TaxID=33978 RepID=A0A1C0Y711_9BACL|nr:S-layer homology domain-containing protein [Caryophanon tenue]OCS82941.1 hypothetical protein A6M13_05950 [Caryophanon tenue]